MKTALSGASCAALALALALPCRRPLAQVNAPEQVLVTASQVPEDGAKLPLAWSSISEEALALVGHTHINEAMQQVSGAWIARGNGQESLIALRSPVLTGAGSCGAFLVAGTASACV